MLAFIVERELCEGYKHDGGIDGGKGKSNIHDSSYVIYIYIYIYAGTDTHTHTHTHTGIDIDLFSGNNLAK